jgi:hypothetical protein
MKKKGKPWRKEERWQCILHNYLPLQKTENIFILPLKMFSVSTWYEITAFLASVSVFFKPSPVNLKRFALFLGIVVITEITGGLMRAAGAPSNQWLYNVYVIVECLFFLWFYYSGIQTHQVRAFIRYAMIAFTIFGCINFFFWQGINTDNSYTLIIECVIVIIAGFIYKRELYVYNVKSAYKRSDNLIHLGILIYLITQMPYTTLIGYFTEKKYFSLTNNYPAIMAGINFIPYLLYTIAFLIMLAPKAKTK